MKDIQEVFNEYQEGMKTMREIRQEYKDTLTQDQEYQMTLEKLEQLKNKKKELEEAAKAQMGSRYEELEDLKHESSNLKEMLSDIAVSTIMRGENIEITDEMQNIYEPRFSVSFKKTSARAIESEEEE